MPNNILTFLVEKQNQCSEFGKSLPTHTMIKV